MKNKIDIIINIKYILDKIINKFKESGIFGKIVQGSFWSLLGALLSRGLFLLSSIIVARILGKELYGELSIIRSTVNMFVVFAGFGLGITATRFISELKKTDKDKAGKVIGVTTLFAFVSGFVVLSLVLLFSNAIVNKTISTPHLINEFQLGAFMLFFASLNGAQTGILAGFEEFKAIAKINLLSGLISFPIQILFTYFLGLKGSVIGFGISFLLLWYFNNREVNRLVRINNIKIRYKELKNEFSLIYKFSLPSLLSGILVTPVIWLCNVFLVNQENGFNELAVYEAANQLTSLIYFIPGTISQVVLPLLVDNRNDRSGFKEVLFINLKINIGIAFIMSIIVSLLSPFLMNLYGDSFKDGFMSLILLSGSAILITGNNIIGKVLASENKMWHGFFLNLAWGIVHVSAAFQFIKLGYGAVGLSLAFIVSYLIHSIVQLLYVRRLLVYKI